MADINGNGFDWERKFGEKWGGMKPDERNMAIYMAITDSYNFMRKSENNRKEFEKKFDERQGKYEELFTQLPCQSCDDALTIKGEHIKGRFSLFTALVSGGLVLLGTIIMAVINYFTHCF